MGLDGGGGGTQLVMPAPSLWANWWGTSSRDTLILSPFPSSLFGSRQDPFHPIQSCTKKRFLAAAVFGEVGAKGGCILRLNVDHGGDAIAPSLSPSVCSTPSVLYSMFRRGSRAHVAEREREERRKKQPSSRFRGAILKVKHNPRSNAFTA